jgi:NAD(P)-dependent dehydrogenase (short-subunit alcohol dehydrogenase family)
MKLPFNIDLSGKVAVVTGAGGVLCAMFAEAIALCGAKVALLDINEDAANKVADEISQKGLTAKGFKCDVLDRKSIEECREKVLEHFGKCDILLNGAGGNSPLASTGAEYYEHGEIDPAVKSFFDLEAKGIEFVFNLNFLGTLLPTQVFAQDMVEKDTAAIINISSMNAYTPLTKIPAYSGAKAAISNFTQWLAVHFSKTGIRVNAIAPGFFVSTQNRALLFTEDGKPTARADKILEATPMGRFGEPEELLGALLWLLSEATGFVTGVVVPVDGGFSAYSGV